MKFNSSGAELHEVQAELHEVQPQRGAMIFVHLILELHEVQLRARVELHEVQFLTAENELPSNKLDKEACKEGTPGSAQCNQCTPRASLHNPYAPESLWGGVSSMHLYIVLCRPNFAAT